jgi:hypothetical protein
MPLLKSSGPFVIRISCDGKPDRYMRNQGELLKFPSMQHGFDACAVFRQVFTAGEYPAIVPVSAVPAGER